MVCDERALEGEMGRGKEEREEEGGRERGKGGGGREGERERMCYRVLVAQSSG